jgi:hypothetical protein
MHIINVDANTLSTESGEGETDGKFVVDTGNGDGDAGNGDGDTGNGDGDVGNGDGDVGDGDGDVGDGNGNFDDDGELEDSVSCTCRYSVPIQ